FFLCDLNGLTPQPSLRARRPLCLYVGCRAPQGRQRHGAVRRIERGRLAPRIIAVGLAPLGQEVGKLVIDLVGQNDANTDQLIAGMAGCSAAHAFALEAEDAAGTGALWQGELHPTGNGWYLDLGTEHGFVDGDGKFQDDIVAGPCELRVRPNLDLDQGVSRLAAAEARRTLALQPQYLPVRPPLRHREA